MLEISSGCGELNTIGWDHGDLEISGRVNKESATLLKAYCAVWAKVGQLEIALFVNQYYISKQFRTRVALYGKDK